MKLFFKSKIIFLLVVLIFLGLNLFGFSSTIRDFFHFTSAPLQQTLWVAGARVTDFFQFFFEFRDLKEEKALTELQIEQLLSELAFLEQLEQENRDLRQALNLDLQKEFQLVLARITAKALIHDSFFINRGKNHGLSEGLPVITSSKVLLGTITKVYYNRSRVMLISHPESLLTGRILQKEISGLVRGQGSLNLSFENLPREAKITKGDVVVTGELMKKQPQGLLIGRVSKIEDSDIEPFQEAEISPFFNINETIYLFVITGF